MSRRPRLYQSCSAIEEEEEEEEEGGEEEKKKKKEEKEEEKKKKNTQMETIHRKTSRKAQVSMGR